LSYLYGRSYKNSALVATLLCSRTPGVGGRATLPSDHGERWLARSTARPSSAGVMLHAIFVAIPKLQL
jgi:hypothetical protein